MKTRLEVNGVERSYLEEISELENLLVFIVKKEKLEEEIIVEVKVDGEIFSENYQHQAREVQLSEVKKVEIITQTKEAFARSFLEQVPNYINNLENGFRSTARLLRDPQQEKNGFDMLTWCLATLQAFKAHIDNVNQVLEKDDRAAGFQDFWERFDRVADKILAAQEGKDPLAIAEQLEEQMLPLLEQWRGGWDEDRSALSALELRVF